MPEIMEAAEELGWTLPTDIQAEAVPLILGGGDVLMAAETGSGKTGAFSMPVIQVVAETLRETNRHERRSQISTSDASRISGKPQARMSTADREREFAISADGLLCQSRAEHNWQGARCELGIIKASLQHEHIYIMYRAKIGKAYYEVELTDPGLVRVGWSTANGTLNLGTDNHGFGFGGTGKKSFARQFEDYGEPFSLGDVIGCLMDLDNGIIGWSKNGTYLGDAYVIPDHLKSKAFFPTCTVKNAELKFNFGSSDFRFIPKDGAQGLDQQPHSYVTTLAECTDKSHDDRWRRSKGPLAVVLEPSRELAEQTLNQMRVFASHVTDVKIRGALLIGGMNARDQIQALNSGIEIVVGTPGRIDDFVKTNKLDLSRVRFFVIDEVDGLISQGHSGLLHSLYERMPKETAGNRLQMIVCSATLHSPNVKKFADEVMYHPVWVDLKGLDAVPDTVHHVVVDVDPRKDRSWQSKPLSLKTDGVHSADNVKPSNLSPETLSEATKILKPDYVRAVIDKHKMDQVIIFCRTRLDCDNLENFLMAQDTRGPAHKYSCACLHGSRGPDRAANLEAFKMGEVRILICTDVAARGIDITGIPFVINVTLPDEKENYIHRIGRVGRADRMGLAISLVSTVPEKVWYHTCPSRGKGCRNTLLKSQGGCTIWYNEPELLRDIQKHLGEEIQKTDMTFHIEQSVYDGKVRSPGGVPVIYGQKRDRKGCEFKGHAELLAPSVAELAELEHQAQVSFLQLQYARKQ
eukprot:gene3769-6291_t